MTELRLLDYFELRTDGVRVECEPATARLVANLAVTRRSWRDRSEVATDLWPDAPAARARANLRTVLWRVTQCGVSPLIDVSGPLVRLHPDVRVDIDKPSETVEAFATGSQLGRLPELLPGWEDEWTISEADRIACLLTTTFESYIASSLDTGDTTTALRLAGAVLHTNPLRESTVELAMSANLLEGNIALAQSLFEKYRTLLKSSLGYVPSPRLADLLSADHRARLAPVAVAAS